jgi:hypothetical protein
MTRGLSIIKDGDQVDDVPSNGLATLCLLAVADKLWVGTSVGLGQVLPGTGAISVPPELAQRATLHVPIYALAQLEDTLVMATERQLLWRNPATHEWSALVLPATLAGPPRVDWGRGGQATACGSAATSLIPRAGRSLERPDPRASGPVRSTRRRSRSRR